MFTLAFSIQARLESGFFSFCLLGFCDFSREKDVCHDFWRFVLIFCVAIPDPFLYFWNADSCLLGVFRWYKFRANGDVRI